MTSKNNRAYLLYYIKLCASFQTHWWIQSGVTVSKRSIWFKIGDFLSYVTLKFDGWHWKTVGHLFYAISSFENHFKAISELKLEWQSWNVQFGLKWAIFETLKFDGWPQKTIGHLFYASPNIWASFRSHLWIQTGITVQKISIWVKINDYFFSPVTLKFDRWPWKIIGHLFYATSKFFYASFLSHLWIKAGDTVQKRPIWVKIDDFF